jgi:hypothetical protein
MTGDLTMLIPALFCIIGPQCVLKSCHNLTGESPVRVIAGEPGSRPRSGEETPQTERGVKSLIGGSKKAGRNIK